MKYSSFMSLFLVSLSMLNASVVIAEDAKISHVTQWSYSDAFTGVGPEVYFRGGNTYQVPAFDTRLGTLRSTTVKSTAEWNLTVRLDEPSASGRTGAGVTIWLYDTSLGALNTNFSIDMRNPNVELVGFYDNAAGVPVDFNQVSNSESGVFSRSTTGSWRTDVVEPYRFTVGAYVYNNYSKDEEGNVIPNTVYPDIRGIAVTTYTFEPHPESTTDSVYYDILDRMRLAQCGNVELAERAKLLTDPTGALLDKLLEKELIDKPVTDAAGVASFLRRLWRASRSSESLRSLGQGVMFLADGGRNLLGAIASIQCSQFDRHGLTGQPDIQPPSPTVPGQSYGPGIADSDGPENQPVDDAFSNLAKGIGSLVKGGSIATRIIEQERNGVPPTDESEAELEQALAEADEQLAEAAESFDQAGGGLRARGVDLAIDQDSIALAVAQLRAGIFDEAYFIALASAMGISEEEARALLDGFPDLDAPNIDPNLQGRDAFEVLAELARKLRPAASQAFPKIILKPNQWYQIALPGPIDAGLTVNDIFGDELDPLYYGSKWVLFSFDPLANKYVNLGLNGIMEQGVGYWIFQITDTDVEISIPNSRYSTPSPPDSDCGSLRCFSTDLSQSEGLIVWNMSGYPFAFERPSETFVVASTEGVCADGCSVNQAFNENMVGPQLWHYDADTGGYEQLNGDNRFQPWDGFWIAVQPSVASSGAGTIQAKFGAP